MKRRLLVGTLILFVGLSLIGCGQQESNTDTVTESPLDVTQAEESFVSPQNTPVPLPTLPTPSSQDVAVVGGVLLRDTGVAQSEPMVEATVQLARVIKSEDGTPMMAASGDDSPTTETNENGQFVFIDVPSGTYGIVVVTPVGSFLLKEDTGADALFDVQQGETVDLGEFKTELPY
jgi:hypothetical protein